MFEATKKTKLQATYKGPPPARTYVVSRERRETKEDTDEPNGDHEAQEPEEDP